MGRPDIPLPAQTPLKSLTWARPFLFTIGTLALLFNLGSVLQSWQSDRAEHDGLSKTTWDEAWIKEHTKCPVQPEPLHPKLIWDLTEDERADSLQKFSAAVQIPTESFDDNGEPDEDDRWAPFFGFQTWLKETFPLAHERAAVEYINTLGILATFRGSDPSLKPLLLMSHYDVVPAPNSTLDRWTHPPFSGHNDGKYIWGRGAGDDKTLLVAQWEAVTHLLQNGFVPRRTIILSHGFDEEEVFARRGQGQMAPFLEKRYGKNGLLLVIDEGAGWTDDFYGAPFALPAMGEKGYMDIKITVATAGGHSSVPPKHTGIGIAAKAVSLLEANQFPVKASKHAKFTPASPILTSLVCAQEHGNLPRKWASLLKKEGPNEYPKLAKSFASVSAFNRAEVGTTTAVDVVHGGVKVNALPEYVTILVNFRIDFAESIVSTQHHITRLLEPLAGSHGLNFASFFFPNATLGDRFIKVEQLGEALEPAPRTPSTGGVWELFAGTIKATFPGPEGKERIVTPSASTGNTDCKMYYNLSKHVYRFTGSRPGSLFAHTVDERALIEGHFDIIRWIHAIVQNTDAYEGEE